MDNKEQKTLLNLKGIILATAKESNGRFQIPQLDHVNPVEVSAVTEHILEMMEEFESLAKSPGISQIREDTDVIWSVPAAGTFSTRLPNLPAAQDRYKHLDWSRRMERYRLRVSSAIARQVASMRTGKPVKDLTTDDLMRYSPIVIYSGTPDQQQNLRAAANFSDYKFPPIQKIHILPGVKNPDGSFRDIVNTVDDVQALTMPKGIDPRRLVVVSHAQHLVRVLHIMGKFHEALPATTIIQPYPILIPEVGRNEYAIMEARGTLAAIYGANAATTYPYNVRST